jgi:hypothetical protein
MSVSGVRPEVSSGGRNDAFDPKRKRPLKDQEVNWPLETLRRSRFADSLRDAEQSEGIRGIRHGYYY